MKTLQDGKAKMTRRGMYSPVAHVMSNEFGILVADCLEQHFGATIESCVVSPSDFGKRPYFVGDTAGFDVVAHKGPKKLCIEVDVKTIKNFMVRKWSNVARVWPDNFPTVDFVYSKYNKPHIRYALQEPNTQVLAWMCLNYVDNPEDFSISEQRTAWSISIPRLQKQPTAKKNNSRKQNEQFYVVPVTTMVLLDLNTGKKVNWK